MALASFDLVYDSYHRIVHCCYGNTMTGRRGFKHEEFEWQPYKLIQAYALGLEAAAEGSIVRTPEWSRRSGASTTACAMTVTSPDVVMLVSDTRAAKHASLMILSAYPEERKNKQSNAAPNFIHDKVWSTSNVDCRVTERPRPELVVVDSDTAYIQKNTREEAIEFLNGLGCAVLVLTGLPQFPHI